MRLLLVEDSKRLRKYVGEGLRHAGYALDLAADGEQGLWLTESNHYDVIILDLMLPKLDGISVLKRLRSRNCKSHVLILTAKDTVHDRVYGLEQGADDYLIKPFALDELLARVQSLIRRRYDVKSPMIRIGNLEIDTVRRCVTCSGKTLRLPPREYALLEYLAFRRSQVVSRTDIERHIYDEQVEPTSNVVDSAIYALRKRIDVPRSPSLIQTRRGLGYVLEDPAL